MTSEEEVLTTSDRAEADVLAAQHPGLYVEEVIVPGDPPGYSYNYLIPGTDDSSLYVVMAPVPEGQLYPPAGRRRRRRPGTGAAGPRGGYDRAAYWRRNVIKRAFSRLKASGPRNSPTRTCSYEAADRMMVGCADRGFWGGKRGSFTWRCS